MGSLRPTTVDGSQSESGRPVGLDTATAVVGGVIALVLVAGFLTLTVVGRSTDAYVLFVTGPIVSTIVGGLLSKKVDRVEQLAHSALSATAQMVPAELLGTALAATTAAAPAPASPRAPAREPVVAQRVG